ncbi:aminopeptidase [Megasphaera paucivorans]|uniref:M18 family aminopeptidase n=1 Tax=Megasphaera paucivorans TaxID=349095 RepID=A0A1H0AWR2_9FIRM|nr:aminopeptidase [Megasphaera paucivorans]SDN37897.1 Aspartyl aminopeptidase [Megasphaera paucivorans]
MKAYDMENSAWARFSEEERIEVEEYNKTYKEFLDTARTERLAVKEIIRQAEAAGFRSIEDVTSLVPGDKIYWNQKGKSAILAVIGENPLTAGLKIVGSHIDSPRLDLKAAPVVENKKIVYLKTHYYGGLRKYQWVCMPLSLIGVVYTTAGEKIDIALGENPNDPVLFINDLLPHLAKDQSEKKLSEAIQGEMLMPMLGCNSTEEKTKPAILTLLKEKYGIEEEDFASAELEVVPTQKSRDAGLDQSMIMSYGHDDRVCSYASLAAILNAAKGSHTQVSLFADKEEIGSVGNTGVQSSFFQDFLAEMLALQGHTEDLSLRRTLRHSEVLSADVSAALDPIFADAYEEANSAKLGYGICICKYTGARGKSGSNDANAEFVSKIRQIFNTANVPWQTGELGKVDQGGGGTIAYIMADWGCEVVDCGVAMLSMHAPLEIVAKTDAYCGYLAYKAFFESK